MYNPVYYNHSHIASHMKWTSAELYTFKYIESLTANELDLVLNKLKYKGEYKSIRSVPIFTIPGDDKILDGFSMEDNPYMYLGNMHKPSQRFILSHLPGELLFISMTHHLSDGRLSYTSMVSIRESIMKGKLETTMDPKYWGETHKIPNPETRLLVTPLERPIIDKFSTMEFLRYISTKCEHSSRVPDDGDIILMGQSPEVSVIFNKIIGPIRSGVENWLDFKKSYSSVNYSWCPNEKKVEFIRKALDDTDYDIDDFSIWYFMRPDHVNIYHYSTNLSSSIRLYILLRLKLIDLITAFKEAHPDYIYPSKKSARSVI